MGRSFLRENKQNLPTFLVGADETIRPQDAIANTTKPNV